jgi:hypothetical protein
MTHIQPTMFTTSRPDISEAESHAGLVANTKLAASEELAKLKIVPGASTVLGVDFTSKSRPQIGRRPSGQTITRSSEFG